MKVSVLIVDDEVKLRKLLSRIISLEGYKISEAGTLSEARTQLERGGIDLMLCDVRLPDGNGVDFTREIKDRYPQLQIILLTAFGNIADGVRATKNGAFDYLVKGDDNDKIVPLLSQASQLVPARKTKVETGLQVGDGFEMIIGKSEALEAAKALAKKVAPTDASVLLTGETGTGKEVFARAIHTGSDRKSKSYVALNCSSFSRELLESTLFGHKAGAFTDAVKDKKGMIEEANGGTLFLDEIGELPLDLQPKLLRFLENGTYYAVGGTKEERADVRIIAATNRALKESAGSVAFRSDLYYRIAVFHIELPALRDRVADIGPLAQFFAQNAAAKIGKQITRISKDALHLLQKYGWAGNIRELKNVIERSVILEDGDAINVDSLPLEIRNGTETISVYDMATMERLHIAKTLKATNGNRNEAAKLLNIGIATLYRKMAEYALKEH